MRLAKIHDSTVGTEAQTEPGSVQENLTTPKESLMNTLSARRKISRRAIKVSDNKSAVQARADLPIKRKGRHNRAYEGLSLRCAVMMQ